MNTPNIHLLFVINYLDRGGAGKMMKYVANLCSSRFSNVTVLSLYEKVPPKDLSDNVNYVPLCRKELRSLRNRLSLMIQLRKEIKALSPNVVCSFVSDVCVMTRIATLLLNCKSVSSERGDPYSLPFIWRILVKWAYQNSDFCIFQLPLARDFFGRKVSEKSFIIPNVFIQERGFVPFVGKRNKTIVSAGRFVPEKNFELLIEAFNKVHKIHSEYKLVIYGDGPLLDKYIRLCSYYGILEEVSFPGYVSSIAEAVRAEGIFVLSSKYEGIPNSLIEALSVGIPCVATDCTPGGPRFLSNDGKNALLVPVDDIEAMTRAIITIIEDENISKQLEEKGSTVLAELTDDVIRKKWLDAFCVIINRK